MGPSPVRTGCPWPMRKDFMRLVVVDRRSLGDGVLAGPADAVHLPVGNVVEVLDRHKVPDGFRFVVDDDGSVESCWNLNQYLLNAWAQRAYDLDSLRDFHAYHLARLLRFVRQRRADAGQPSNVDLTDTTRADLVAYRDVRLAEVEESTFGTEMGCVGSFFFYAVTVGWMDHDPIPRWGRRQRNTLVRNTRRERRARFLTAPQTRHFLEAGLRGDGAPADAAPGFPERDYVYGLLLASTGLRREEGALLLDCEVPPPASMGPEGIHVFDRLGKKKVLRSIYVTPQVAHAVDLYRRTERSRIVASRQRLLRKKVQAGDLLVVDGVVHRGDRTYIAQGRKRTPASRFSNKDRKRAVIVNDDGTIEPLALLVARHGLPSTLERWNHIFTDARERVRAAGSVNQPPQHITVTPHTMRHSFAVRMLAALMKEGRARANDPYLLLANPVLTVKELLGHADLKTTMHYLHAAETWTEEVPKALSETAADLVGHTKDDPGPDPDAVPDDYDDLNDDDTDWETT